MALIKCPKCGKEMNDKAASCPQCGATMEEIKAALKEHVLNDASPAAVSQPQEEKNERVETPEVKEKAEKKRMPAWAWVAIAAAGLLLAGGAVWYILAGRAKGDNATRFVAFGNNSISEINGVSIDEYTKYTTNEGNTYYYRNLDGLYDKNGKMVYGLSDYSVTEMVDVGTNLAMVMLFCKDPVGTSEYNSGGYGIAIIDQSANKEMNALYGFNEVSIVNDGGVHFFTMIANVPVVLTIEDVLACTGYNENALEHLFNQYVSANGYMEIADEPEVWEEFEMEVVEPAEEIISVEVAEEAVAEEEDEIYQIVEQDPVFPGGMEALYRYLQNNIQYPQLARENNISGRVFVQFVIEKDGSISNVRLARDIGGGCGAEAVRVVRSMPRWTPGRNRGRVVRSAYTLPISFNLN